MEKGVSSCGGRLVRPIIGRFCGYRISGRSPLSNGSVTVSIAKAFAEVKPVAIAAMPARLINSRLSSIRLPLEASFVEAWSPPDSSCMFRIEGQGVNSCFLPAWNCRCVATRQDKTPAACRDRGIFFEPWGMRIRSVTTDVDGAQAVAERRQHRPSHIAAVVAASDVADTEAVAPVVMVATEAAAPSTAHWLGGSGGRSQCNGTERSCGNKCKSEFA